jgi:hypothetical protein
MEEEGKLTVAYSTNALGEIKEYKENKENKENFYNPCAPCTLCLLYSPCNQNPSVKALKRV